MLTPATFDRDTPPRPIRDAMLPDSLRPKDGWLIIFSGPSQGVDVGRGVLRRFAV